MALTNCDGFRGRDGRDRRVCVSIRTAAFGRYECEQEIGGSRGKRPRCTCRTRIGRVNIDGVINRPAPYQRSEHNESLNGARASTEANKQQTQTQTDTHTHIPCVRVQVFFFLCCVYVTHSAALRSAYKYSCAPLAVVIGAPRNHDNIYTGISTCVCVQSMHTNTAVCSVRFGSVG